MDVLSAFLAECCILKRSAQAKASALFTEWQRWCEQSGEFAGNQRKFGQALTERGFQKIRLETGFHYEGIGLLLNDPEPSEPFSPIFTPPTSSAPNLCQKGSARFMKVQEGGQVYCADCSHFQRGKISTTGSCACSDCPQKRKGPSLLADQLRECAHFQPIEFSVDDRNREVSEWN